MSRKRQCVEKKSPNYLYISIPDDSLLLILDFLNGHDHARFSQTSKYGREMVEFHEHVCRDYFSQLPSPSTELSVFAGNFVPNLTKFVNLRQHVIQLPQKITESVNWVYYHIGHNLFNNAAAIANPTESSDVAIRGSVNQSFDLISALLLRWRKEKVLGCQPMLTPEAEQLHPNFQKKLISVFINSLRYLNETPGFAPLLTLVQSTLSIVIPARLCLYPDIKQMVINVIKPLLLSVANFQLVQPIHLRYLSQILQAMSHCINKTLGDRLWEHMKKCTDMDLSNPPHRISPDQVPFLALSLMQVFPLLPESEDHVTHLIKYTIKIESLLATGYFGNNHNFDIMSFRRPLSRFLKKHLVRTYTVFDQQAAIADDSVAKIELLQDLEKSYGLGRP